MYYKRTYGHLLSCILKW